MNFEEFKTAILNNGDGGVPEKNYSTTQDPNVVIGKHGATITRQQYEQSLKQEGNNMKFKTFEDYADWVGGWANKEGKSITGNIPPVPGQTTIQSDKAAGLSNNYYPANNQNKQPALPTINGSWGY